MTFDLQPSNVQLYTFIFMMLNLTHHLNRDTQREYLGPIVGLKNMLNGTTDTRSSVVISQNLYILLNFAFVNKLYFL